MQCSDVNKGGEVLLIHIFLPTLSFQSRGLNRQHSSSLILINTQYCTMNDELLHVDTGFGSIKEGCLSGSDLRADMQTTLVTHRFPSR